MASPDLVDYYRRRAGEYEAIYAKPERQRDLQLLAKIIPERMAGRRVLEIACGTGYWTALAAPAARSVLATDAAEEPMAIARGKAYPDGKVRFELADAYALGPALGTFDAALAVFWWSHVPRGSVGAFLASLHARLEAGARVVLMDNRYVEGSSTPLAERDAAGDTWQMRQLADGGRARVLKNFPTQEELRRFLGPSLVYEELEHYWLAEYVPELKKLVLASGNPGKVREIRALLAPLGLEVVPQAELGVAEAEEPHDTFLENALAKARHASRATGLPALADDSGLCVEALGGEPGVHSAYYAGRDGGREERDARNNRKLLGALTEGRNAYYCCVMVLVRHPADPRPLVAEGIWHGEIARGPRGANGFGYDPLFLLPQLGKTAAELDPMQKNRISHRGLALEKLLLSLK